MSRMLEEFNEMSENVLEPKTAAGERAQFHPEGRENVAFSMLRSCAVGEDPRHRMGHGNIAG